MCRRSIYVYVYSEDSGDTLREHKLPYIHFRLNCFKNEYLLYDEVRYDEDYICDKAVLPIIGFKTTFNFKEIQLTVGPLICEGTFRLFSLTEILIFDSWTLLSKFK